MVSWLMKNRIIIEPKYEEAEDFLEGLAAVCVKARWGFIGGSSIKLELKLPPIVYQEVENFSEGLAVIKDEHVNCSFINIYI